MNSRPTLYILDAFSLFYQVFHAIPVMSSPDGRPTNAVFGVFRDLLGLAKNRRPDYLAAAFDGEGPVFRSEILPEYKAQRAAMPDDLVPQIDVIRRVYEGFRVPVLTFEGMEADDVIATTARRAVERGLDVVICTADKDARQLIDDHTKILNLRKNEFMDVEVLKREWGVRPDQVVDLLALTGDAVDNVPGVPGIGLKTATALLQEFDTIDNLLKNVEKVSGAKRKENLKSNKGTLDVGRRLIRLRDDLELNLDWKSLAVEPPDVQALRTICIECGFHQFLKEIAPVAEEPSLFASLSEAPATKTDAKWPMDYRVADTPETLAELVAKLSGLDKFSIDTETTSVDPLRADLVGISIAIEENDAYYIPVRGPAGARALSVESVLDALRPILLDPTKEKVGQNLKYDMLVFRRHGLDIKGPITDTMVLSYLLESGERNHSLDQLSQRLLNHEMIPITDLIGKGKNQITMDRVEIAKVAKYAGEDADAAWRLEAILAPRIREQGLSKLHEEIERPLIRVLAEMEAVGIKIDANLLRKLAVEFGERLVAIEDEIYRLAGRPFNINSPIQLRDILFKELKLPVTQKTPGGDPSTAQEVLEELAPRHPLPRSIIEHRRLSKLKGTYLDTLPDLAHESDGRIHASFNQVVAATGRLSSSDPNLQNIPVRTEDGRQIRQAFIPGEPGWSLLTADYSQIELRVLAHFSGDPALKKAFDGDQDIHAAVASRIFAIPVEAVNDSQRQAAKAVNFGVIYGLSPFGLAGRLGISQSDAALFIDAYFKEYAGVDSFITKTLELTQKRGYVETILGRRRAIQGIKATTGRNRNLPERTAVNTVIQGSAADLIKKAMLDVDRAIRETGSRARMLLQIHDELVFEAPDSEIESLASVVQAAMTGALPLDVPIKVDLAFGPNWLDVRELPS